MKFLQKIIIVWGVTRKTKKVPGEVFWPCIDPDIPSYPYCKRCKDKLQMKLFIEMSEQDYKMFNKNP